MVIVERRGEPQAVVISPAEYDRLMSAAEEVNDIAAFDTAMAEEGPNIPGGRSRLISAGRPRMSCEIELRPAALRALKRVDRQDQPRIQGAIALLAADPRPPGAKALQGCDALRIRVGDYRTIYTVQDNRLLVIVVTLGHRREVDR